MVRDDDDGGRLHKLLLGSDRSVLTLGSVRRDGSVGRGAVSVPAASPRNTDGRAVLGPLELLEPPFSHVRACGGEDDDRGNSVRSGSAKLPLAVGGCRSSRLADAGGAQRVVRSSVGARSVQTRLSGSARSAGGFALTELRLRHLSAAVVGLRSPSPG
jgi:hypothetical protein